MTGVPLLALRSQLNSLRRARSRARWLTALSAMGIALLWLLGGLFLLDWCFQREIHAPQRILLMAIAGVIFVWAFRRYAVPFLVVRETEIDIALLVERRHQLENDLVAALQFEPDLTILAG